tara:strand:+ start:928 stop:2433 length:1506 start_codon:yes stop_codon:yes gene_type:complete
MSKQKRSRALLRNLRKQARKGTLSAREKQQLASQEKKFRKARKSTAKGVGAGLAGAAALLSTTAGQQLMSGAKDFMGRASDRRDARADGRLDRKVARADERSKKEKQKLEELARQREEETGVRMAEGADRAEEADREEDRQKLIARADEFERQEAQDRERVTRPVTDVDFGMGAEGPSREEFDRLQMDRSMDFSDPIAMGAARASSRDAAADLGRAEFDRAQRILAGGLTGDSRVDFGFDIEDQPKEQDFPNEFFPLDQVYESRERSRRERPGFNPDDKGPMGDGGKVGVSHLLDYLEGHEGPMSEKDYKEQKDILFSMYRKGHMGIDEYNKNLEKLNSMGFTKSQEDGGKVEYGIGGAIMNIAGNALQGKKFGEGLFEGTLKSLTPYGTVAGAGNLAQGLGQKFDKPGLEKIGGAVEQGANLVGGINAQLAGSILGKMGVPGGNQMGQAVAGLYGGQGGGGIAGLLGGLSAEKGMKVQQMRQGGRAADLKKMIAKKYGFR